MIGRIRITRRRSGAWRALALAAVLLLGCDEPASPESAVSSSGADEDVAPEPAPEIEPVAAQEPSFGPTLPYSVELGRGGGRSGLETIRVEPDGAVTLHRNPSRRGGVGWEWATLALSEPQRAELTESLGRHRVLTLDGRYSAGIADGTQWVLRIVHGEEEHVVYCDNRCPDGVVPFAVELDRVMASAGIRDVSWTPVEGAGHDDALWDAVRRTVEPARRPEE